MRPWTRILPFFIVEYVAKKYGEKWYDEQTKSHFTYPYKDVRLYFKEEKSK